MSAWTVLVETPANTRFIRFMVGRHATADDVALSLRNARTDPYLHAGTHPDVVEHVWSYNDRLGVDCRYLTPAGTPVLAHPTTGRVLMGGLGTSYVVWLPPEEFEQAVSAGHSPRQTWGSGRVTDLFEEVGDGWLFGKWARQEEEWVLRAFEVAGGG